MAKDDRIAGNVAVLESVYPPGKTTNPYISMLAAALSSTPGITTHYFSWRIAIFGRYQVLHLHWPENLMVARTRTKRQIRSLLFGALLIRLKTRPTAVVRTLHNNRPHEGVSTVQNWLLEKMDKRTTWWIILNDAADPSTPSNKSTIPHGHYVGWYKGIPVPNSIPGRILYFGLIRDYKNLPVLIREFMEIVENKSDYSLRIVGKPQTSAIRRALVQQISRDTRISATLDFVSERELANEVGLAEVVVLPYREMYNSGSALLALSLGRAILVPDNAVSRSLGMEVGEEWVLRYAGGLTASAIIEAISRSRSREPASKPNLTGREWTRVGIDHRTAFLSASSLRQAGR